MITKKLLASTLAANLCLWSLVAYKNIVATGPGLVGSVVAVAMVVASFIAIVSNTSES